MRLAPRLLGALLCASLAFGSVPARAGEPTAADKETARTLMAAGRDKRRKGDHKGALESFKAADAIMHVPTTGLEVGRTQADLGLLIEARDTLLAVARSTPKPGEPEPFAKARTAAEELAEAIAPRIPSINLKLVGVAPSTSTKVIIDGTEVAGGYLGVPRKINPGAHVIVVKGSSGTEKTTNVEIAEGATKDVTIDFSDAKAPVSGGGGGGATDTEPSRTSPLVYAGFGLAGVGLIAGSVTGLMHLSKTSAVKDECPNGKCPPSAHDDYDQAKSYATISTVSFIVAGVGATLGVVGIFMSGKPAPASSGTSGGVKVMPWIGWGAAGVYGAF